MSFKIKAVYSDRYTPCRNYISTSTPVGRLSSLPSPSGRLCLLFLLAALAAGGLAACGSTVSTGNFKGESKVVAERVSSFQSDLVAGSEQKLCANDLARAVQARLRAAGSTCQLALKHQIGAITDYEMSVQKIAIHGPAATAQVKSTWSGKQRFSVLALVKEGGAWKITAVQ